MSNTSTPVEICQSINLPRLRCFNVGVPDGRRVFEYDDRGRVVRNELFAGAQSVRVETTSYNEWGLVDTETSPEGVIHYDYNVYGQVTRTSFSGSAFVPANAIDFENVTEFAYDSIGRLASVTVTERNNVLLSNPENTEYSYDLAGSLQSTEYENGVMHSYVYDSLRRLDDLFHWVDADGDGVRAANETLASFDYSVRADGNDRA